MCSESGQIASSDLELLVWLAPTVKIINFFFLFSTI